MERRKAIFGQCFERGHDVHQNAADAILTKPLNRSGQNIELGTNMFCHGQEPNFPGDRQRNPRSDPHPVGLSLSLALSRSHTRVTPHAMSKIVMGVVIKAELWKL